MLIVLLIAALLLPSPLTSMAVVPQAHADRVDVVVHFLNSDPRYQDFVITVGDVPTPITAPLRMPQTITTTIPLSLPPVCNAQAAYSIIVGARVLTDTTTFARQEIGGAIQRPCPRRTYLPI